MISARRTHAMIALVGLAGSAWCVTLFIRHGLKDIFTAVLAAGWGVAAVVAFHFVPMLCDVMSWRVVIPPSYRLKTRDFLLIRWMGDAVNSMLPVAQVGGELVRMSVATLWGIPFNISAASVLVDMTLCVLTQILFALAGFWLLVSLSGHNTIDRTLIVGVIVGLLAIGGFYAVQRIGIFRIGGAIISGVLKSPTWQKMAADGHAIDKAIAQLYGRRRSVLACALWIMGTWSTGAVEVWIALHALGVPVSYAKAFVLESANQAIRSVLFILPGAMGAQEAGFLTVGTLLGISQEMSMALALIRRVREVAFGVPGVLAWQWIEWRRLRPTLHAEPLAAPVRA
jgi:putative membrane protein